MTHQAHPLPAYLSDLTFCLNGQTLKVHPPSEDQRLSHIGLVPSPTGDVGVFLSAEEERAEVRCSQALIRYNQGYETCFIAWDDANPVPEKVGSFEGWLRGHVLRDIDRILRWAVEELGEDPGGFAGEAAAQLCADMSDLPDLPFSHTHHCGALFKMLGAVHRISERGRISGEDEQAFEAFRLWSESTPHRGNRALADTALRLALDRLVERPKALEQLIQARAEALLAPCRSPENRLETDAFLQLVSELANEPAAVQKLAHSALLEHCTDSKRTHACLVAFLDSPAVAHAFADHGLRQKDAGMSFLVVAEGLYQGNPNAIGELQEVRSRIEALGASPQSSENVQEWIDRYTRLANDYRFFHPKTKTRETGPELLDLEKRLNAYWLSLLPSENAPSCPPIEEELTAQRRFVSGSAGYLGWLRDKRRYAEVGEAMASMPSDGRLHHLRHRSSPLSFEALLNNGMGALLDSRDKGLLRLALAILTPWRR